MSHPAAEPATPDYRHEQPSLMQRRRSSLRLPATLLLTGQLLYIVVTFLHTGGEANDHHDVFAEYADSGSWTVVHLGQFAGMAIFLAGLLALSSAVDGPARLTARFGAAAATATLALYAALQAVDGVALKQAVTAWASAPRPRRRRASPAPRPSAGWSGACAATRTSPSASPCCSSRPRPHGRTGSSGRSPR